jgi:serine/threonine-protein kinase
VVELEPQLKGALGERYRIERPLASGGMGHLFLARDVRQGNRYVAIKVLRPEIASTVGAQRFLREIEVTSVLENAHIVPIFDSGAVGDLLYYVMPWVEGESLADRLARDKRLPLRDALRFTDQVLDALECAHAHGVVHRDIKPGNILLSGRDARLTDFGIACLVEDAGAPHLTRTGLVIGTPLYMSPEQVLGRAADARSDLFGLGCVLFEMLTGEVPFVAESAHATLERRVREPAPSLRSIRPDLSEELDRVLARALARAPEERFGSAAEFAAALEAATIPALAPRPRVKWAWSMMLLGVVGIAAATGLRFWAPPGRATAAVTLAVLPLDNVSGDRGQDWFADAMTGELIRALSQVPGMKVIARTSVLRYGSGEPRPRQVARELGADALLEGTVQRAGQTIRISATLVDGDTESNLWSGQYDRSMGDVLRLQSEVARDIARHLDVRLAPRLRHRARSATTADPRAYEAYLEGRAAWNRRSLEGYQEAIGHFERAIALSPKFADAHSGLADVYSLIWLYGVLSPDEAYSRARTAAEEALALDSTSADAWASLGVVHSENTWQWAESERAFRQAIRWNPNHASAHQWYSELLSKLGRTPEAMEQIQIARELDPLSPLVRGHVGTTEYLRREPQRALPEFAAATALDSSYWLTRFYYGLTLEQLGRVPDALRELRAAVSLAPGNSLPQAALGYVLARAGQPETARGILAALQRPELRDRVPPTHLALLHVGLGDTAHALDELDRAFEVRDPLLSFLGVAPALDPLRGIPRFKTLLERMQYPARPVPPSRAEGERDSTHI